MKEILFWAATLAGLTALAPFEIVDELAVGTCAAAAVAAYAWCWWTVPQGCR